MVERLLIESLGLCNTPPVFTSPKGGKQTAKKTKGGGPGSSVRDSWPILGSGEVTETPGDSPPSSPEAATDSETWGLCIDEPSASDDSLEISGFCLFDQRPMSTFCPQEPRVESDLQAVEALAMSREDSVVTRPRPSAVNVDLREVEDFAIPTSPPASPSRRLPRRPSTPVLPPQPIEFKPFQLDNQIFGETVQAELYETSRSMAAAESMNRAMMKLRAAPPPSGTHSVGYFIAYKRLLLRARSLIEDTKKSMALLERRLLWSLNHTCNPGCSHSPLPGAAGMTARRKAVRAAKEALWIDLQRLEVRFAELQSGQEAWRCLGTFTAPYPDEAKLFLIADSTCQYYAARLLNEATFNSLLPQDSHYMERITLFQVRHLAEYHHARLNKKDTKVWISRFHDWDRKLQRAVRDNVDRLNLAHRTQAL